MKVRSVFACILCVIVSMLLVSCSLAPKTAVNSDSLLTPYGDRLDFRFSTSCTFHHDFITYKITYTVDVLTTVSTVRITLRDQPKSVYEDPISAFKEVSSKDGITLYEIGGCFVFVYGNGMVAFDTDDDRLKEYEKSELIDRFKEIIFEREADAEE